MYRSLFFSLPDGVKIIIAINEIKIITRLIEAIIVSNLFLFIY